MIPSSALNFFGHIMAGMMFVVLGTWWTVGAWHAYTLQRRKIHHRKRAYFVLAVVKPRCIEGFYKVVCGAIGVALSCTLVDRGFSSNGKAAQHMSIFLFICLSGAVDLLTDYGTPLPRGTDFVGLLMALSIEALLFYFHQLGKQALDSLLHALLCLTVALEAACVVIEMVQQQIVLATLGRAFFGILQGSWLCHIAFILYNPLPGARPWEDTHENLMLAPAVYTWHALGVLIYLSVVGTFVSLCSGKYRDSCKTEDVNSSLLPLHSAMTEGHGVVGSAETHSDISSDGARNA